MKKKAIPEEYQKKGRGKRGADKQPRDHKGGMPKKAEADKAHSRSVKIYDWEFEWYQDKYGSLTKALRSLNPVKPK